MTKPLVPGSVPFLERPREFLTLLHAARLKWLLEAPARKKKDPNKAPKPKGLGGGKRKKRVSTADQTLLAALKGVLK